MTLLSLNPFPIFLGEKHTAVFYFILFYFILFVFIFYLYFIYIFFSYIYLLFLTLAPPPNKKESSLAWDPCAATLSPRQRTLLGIKAMCESHSVSRDVAEDENFIITRTTVEFREERKY